MVESELRVVVVAELKARPGRIEDVAAQLVEAWSEAFVRGALGLLLPKYLRRVARLEAVDRGVLARRPGALSDRLCECGCGERTMVSPRTRPEHGWVRGEGRRFAPGHGPTLSPDQWVVDSATGCWVWQRTTKNGYGIVEVAGRRLKAHRWLYMRRLGVSLEGLELHHACRNKLCVNPAHLDPLTRAEHRRRHAA